jgi:hypothetical protein
MNDMRTGFSRKNFNNKYGSGLDYRTNKTFCGYYDRTLQPDGSCDMTAWEKFADSVFGMSLVNTLKSAVRLITNGGKPFDLPQNLPPYPESVPTKFARVGWKKYRRQLSITDSDRYHIHVIGTRSRKHARHELEKDLARTRNVNNKD